MDDPRRLESIDLRASDADRERVVSQLRKHFTAGRITLDEFEERTERAYASRTVGQLRELTSDLPAPQSIVNNRVIRSRGFSENIGKYLFIAAALIGLLVIVGMGHFWPLGPIFFWGFWYWGCRSGGRTRPHGRR